MAIDTVNVTRQINRQEAKVERLIGQSIRVGARLIFPMHGKWKPLTYYRRIDFSNAPLPLKIAHREQHA